MIQSSSTQLTLEMRQWLTENRPLFEALAAVCPPGKLRYLVYPGKDDRDYWLGCRDRGAIVLGKDANSDAEA